MSEQATTSGHRRARRIIRETLSVAEAAELLGVSCKTIRNMIKEKKLRTVQAIPTTRIEESHLRRVCRLEGRGGTGKA